MRTIPEILRLAPDLYDKTSSSNFYNIVYVKHSMWSEIDAIRQQLQDINDINNMTGATLDNEGASWGVNRNGQTDDNFRAEILTKKYLFFISNNDQAILSYVRKIIPTATSIDIFYRRDLAGFLLDGTLVLDGTLLLDGGFRKNLSFDVRIIMPGAFKLDGLILLDGSRQLNGYNLSGGTLSVVTSGINKIRAGGIEGTVNLTF